jgi:uncharacterized repeat protein (TIGR03803 family)
MKITGKNSAPSLYVWGIALALTMVLLTAVTAKAQTFSVLYSFTGGADGGSPNGGLILDAEGNLYGNTAAGGLNNCVFGTCGVVFKVDSSTGNETVLYSFCPGGNPCTDGWYPSAALGPVTCVGAGTIVSPTGMLITVNIMRPLKPFSGMMEKVVWG